MRLDKYLGQSGVATRSEATKFIRARRVTVDGAVVRDPAQHIDPDTASVMLDGQPQILIHTKGFLRFSKNMT